MYNKFTNILLICLLTTSCSNTTFKPRPGECYIINVHKDDSSLCVEVMITGEFGCLIRDLNGSELRYRDFSFYKQENQVDCNLVKMVYAQ